jgi:hypothetical protein
MVRRRGRPRTAAVGLLNLAGSAVRLVLRPRDRALARWTLVHLYAFAPRRVLDRYR